MKRIATTLALCLAAGCNEVPAPVTPEGGGAERPLFDPWALQGCLQEGCAIHVATVVEVKEEERGHAEVRHIKLNVDETLWGETGPVKRRYTTTKHHAPPPPSVMQGGGMMQGAGMMRRGPGPRPPSQRVPRGHGPKQQHPSGPPQVAFPPELDKGARLLLISRTEAKQGTLEQERGGEREGDVERLVHVSRITEPNGASMSVLRALILAEKRAEGGDQRRARYLGWVAQGSKVEQRYGAAALARQTTLPGVDPSGEVAASLASLFQKTCDLDLLGAMILSIAPRTSPSGQAAILAAIARGTRTCEETEADDCRESLDKLAPQWLGQKRAETAALLDKARAGERDGAVREELRRLADKLREPDGEPPH